MLNLTLNRDVVVPLLYVLEEAQKATLTSQSAACGGSESSLTAPAAMLQCRLTKRDGKRSQGP